MLHTQVIEVEVEGLEELHEQLVDIEDVLTEIRMEAEVLANLKKEESVFEAELGNGIKFKGTKSDFEVFVSGLSEMFTFAKGMGF